MGEEKPPITEFDDGGMGGVGVTGNLADDAHGGIWATKEINMAGAGGSGIPGDVNGDGVVNAADIVMITNIIMGTE